MKLSTKGKYGLYAMFYLAQHAGDGPQPLKEISAIGISEKFIWSNCWAVQEEADW